MEFKRKVHTVTGFRTRRTPSMSSTPQQVDLHDAEDEEFNTRCLSSYYSIFVARLAIMVMLAIIIAMLTVLTWHFTKQYTTKSLNSLAYGLRYELLQRPILRMWNILNSTVEITIAQVKLSEYVIGRHGNSISQSQQGELYQEMKQITWALFASRKALNSITVSYKSGFSQAFQRDRKNNNTFYIYSASVSYSVNHSKEREVMEDFSTAQDVNSSEIWYRVPLDPITGETIGNPQQISSDKLISIAGQQQIHDGTASWRVAVSKSTESPLLSAALPVKHPSKGSVEAVVGVTTALKSVGQLMKELVDIHSGYMYLTTREGHVLATSTDAPLLKNTSNGLKLMMANDSDDQIIRSGAKWLQNTYGDKFPMNNEAHATNVDLRNQRYYIDSFFLNLKRLPLVGVIIIPRKYIMGKVDHIGFTTMVISICAAICTLAIGCVCILILTSGVSKAMKLKAELISQLDARRRAEASNNYKSQFLANMSHELRTPMAAIIGLLDILMDEDCLTNEQLATVTQIRKCSTALLRLLNNILDLSKVESGKLILEEAEFDLGRELEGIVDIFSVQYANQKVDIILDLSDDLPNIVKGDSARIVQIFTNLISNSSKFTSEGHIILRGWCTTAKNSNSPEWPMGQKMPAHAHIKKTKQNVIDLKADSEKKNAIAIWFEVEDTGCGIDPNKWETVFESFEQGDPSTTRTHGGTGLGLCIVRNLVNKMGGKIEVVKKDGPGTLIQLYLVLGISDGDIGNNIKPEFSKHRLTVLLALRSNKARHIMSKWLRDNGIFTWEASEWNMLAQKIQQVSHSETSARNCFEECSARTATISRKGNDVSKHSRVHNQTSSNIVIVIDTSILDQSTNIWIDQLNFLEQYHGIVKFAWILSHDTSNTIKVELRQRGHHLMVNKPLYKTKMINILQNATTEARFENQTTDVENVSQEESMHECHEIDSINFEIVSSDESSNSDTEMLGIGQNEFPAETKNNVAVNNQYCELSNSGNVCFVQEQECPKILQTDLVDACTPNKNHKDLGRSYEVKAGQQNVAKSLTYYLHDAEVSAVGGPTIDLYKDVIVDKDQLISGKDDVRKEKYQSQTTSNMHDAINMKRKAPEKETISTASTLDNQKKEYCNQGKQELDSIGSRTNMIQDIKFSNRKTENVAQNKMVPEKNSLEGLCILLAEDNQILQLVATKMLEKVGAQVVVVHDGMQAVNAVRPIFCTEECKRSFNSSTQGDGEKIAMKPTKDDPPFDLILMDCQMPNLDGYEATKAIRKLEAGTGSHIPIVAVTAHAMSSDEAKCLEVGMDAYLAKPINSKLMISIILSLTKRNS
ncbi:hypothetical protein KFK09_010247 [Dendrobium nobile]|uniref:histidine kinase n=1 Tax=Dendrobium nobile TaxID=94219 RepID=A0A8T3BLM6_DENNO|nr:hypothetical protein KFK09_010247 [Dendrobium nobile]